MVMGPIDDLVLLGEMPHDISDIEIQPGLNASKNIRFDGAKIRNVFADLKPIDPIDPSIKAWAYAPLCRGSFHAAEGRYTFELFLGGRGWLLLPSGKWGFFSFEFDAVRD